MKRSTFFILIVSVLACWAFFRLAEMMLSGDFETVNVAFMQGVPAWHAGWLTPVMMGLTSLGSLAGMALVGLLAAVFLQRQGERLDGSIAILVLLGAAVWTFSLKGVYLHARPQVFPQLLPETGYSFPSGHSLASWCFFGYLAVWAGEHRRPLMALACVFLAMTIPLSRLYLGVHWPTDVLGGLFIGTSWLGLCLALRQHLLDDKIRHGKGRTVRTGRQRRLRQVPDDSV